jgi:hypothetical protein
MSTTISQLQTEGLQIKLTDEKLFITTTTSTETFALRSIDGIGVIDLIENLNENLNKYKAAQIQSITWFVLGGAFFLLGLYAISLMGIAPASVVLLFAAVMVFAGIQIKSKNPKPTLQSAVRIMMTGGNRDFMFDKANSNSIEVAEFVAKVEDTLTAFHKK